MGRYGGGRNSAIATVVNARFQKQTGRYFPKDIPSREDDALRKSIEKDVKREFRASERSERSSPDLGHLAKENKIPANAAAIQHTPTPRRAVPTDMRNAERELVRHTLMGGHPARLEEITANTPSKGKFFLASVPVDLSHTGDEAAMEAARNSPTAISPMAAAGRMRSRVFDTREAARVAVQEFDAKHGTKYEAHLAAGGDFEDKHPRVPAGSSAGGEFRSK